MIGLRVSSSSTPMSPAVPSTTERDDRMISKGYYRHCSGTARTAGSPGAAFRSCHFISYHIISSHTQDNGGISIADKALAITREGNRPLCGHTNRVNILPRNSQPSRHILARNLSDGLWRDPPTRSTSHIPLTLELRCFLASVEDLSAVG